eukprot:COSAG01_NODE_14635_length_1428_cov_4.850688_1_plen_383_part_10
MKKADLQSKLTEARAQTTSSQATPEPNRTAPMETKPKKVSKKPSIELEPETSSTSNQGVISGGSYADFIKHNLSKHGGDMKKTAAAYRAQKGGGNNTTQQEAAHDTFMDATHEICADVDRNAGDLQEATDDYCEQFLENSGYWDDKDETVPDGYAQDDNIDAMLEGGAYWTDKTNEQDGGSFNWEQLITDVSGLALMAVPGLGEAEGAEMLAGEEGAAEETLSKSGATETFPKGPGWDETPIDESMPGKRLRSTENPLAHEGEMTTHSNALLGDETMTTRGNPLSFEAPTEEEPGLVRRGVSKVKTSVGKALSEKMGVKYSKDDPIGGLRKLARENPRTFAARAAVGTAAVAGGVTGQQMSEEFERDEESIQRKKDLKPLEDA